MGWVQGRDGNQTELDLECKKIYVELSRDENKRNDVAKSTENLYGQMSVEPT